MPDTPADVRLPADHPDWGWEFRLENFLRARIVADRDTGELSAAAADALLHTVGLHSTYIGSDGTNWARCYTCDPVHGVPCQTLRSLAAAWATHPDHPYAQAAAEGRYTHHSDLFGDVETTGTFLLRHRARTTTPDND